MEDKIMKANEVCKFLGVHRDTLRKYVNDKLINVYKTPGGHNRFKLSELQAFVNKK